MLPTSTFDNGLPSLFSYKIFDTRSRLIHDSQGWRCYLHKVLFTFSFFVVASYVRYSTMFYVHFFHLKIRSLAKIQFSSLLHARRDLISGASCWHILDTDRSSHADHRNSWKEYSTIALLQSFEWIRIRLYSHSIADTFIATQLKLNNIFLYSFQGEALEAHFTHILQWTQHT